MFKKIFLNFILPVIILIFGIFIFKKIKSLKKQPPKVKIERRIPFVETVYFKKKDIMPVIKESGTVSYPDELTVLSRVSGNIVKLSPNLYIGGFLKKGEVIAKIEQNDYLLGIEAAKAEVLNRESLLKKEEENSKLAKIEWEIYKKSHPDAKASELRLRIPQLNSAKAMLNVAKVNLKKNKLNLSRTVIKSPFDAVVKYKNVSEGQFVGPGSVIAKLQGIKRAYISIYLKDDDFKYIDIFNKETEVKIFYEFGGNKAEKSGKIISYNPNVDPKTKMKEIIVEIKYPLKDKKTPLLAGDYVEIRVKGKMLKNVFLVPEDILHGDKIYILKKGYLEIKKVKILRQEGKFFIIKGLTEKDEVIKTPLADVVNNMKVKAVKGN